MLAARQSSFPVIGAEHDEQKCPEDEQRQTPAEF
jgi:hypothetical protein